MAPEEGEMALGFSHIPLHGLKPLEHWAIVTIIAIDRVVDLLVIFLSVTHWMVDSGERNKLEAF